VDLRRSRYWEEKDSRRRREERRERGNPGEERNAEAMCLVKPCSGRQWKEEHGEERLEASPLLSPSPSRDDIELGFSFPTSRVGDGSPGERCGGVHPLMDNQTVP
jgi:hypothetical protein